MPGHDGPQFRSWQPVAANTFWEGGAYLRCITASGGGPNRRLQRGVAVASEPGGGRYEADGVAPQQPAGLAYLDCNGIAGAAPGCPQRLARRAHRLVGNYGDPRRPLGELRQAVQIISSDRLLHRGDPEMLQLVADPAGGFERPRAIGSTR